MKTLYMLGLAGLLLLPAVAAARAQAGNYPDKPVTIIADAAPGATPDVDARAVADGGIAAHAASDAVPDGYTLFMPAFSTFAALQTTAPNLPLKLPRDFIPIGYTAENPMFFAVNPSIGIASLPQLIAAAKKDPGKISIAVTGVGRMTHLTGLLFQERADVSLLPVPYNSGPAAALADVVSDRVAMIIEGYSGIVG